MMMTVMIIGPGGRRSVEGCVVALASKVNETQTIQGETGICL